MPRFGIMVSFVCSLDSLNCFCFVKCVYAFWTLWAFVVSEHLIMHYFHNHSEIRVGFLVIR
jgi:hypothetical protein